MKNNQKDSGTLASPNPDNSEDKPELSASLLATPLLDQVKWPEDLRDFSVDQLKQLVCELREETIDVVSETGGHLGASLGVVELTVALHYIFNTPHDKLLWDVGHQSYPHKILTGRRSRIRSLRQQGGLSGFVKREESPYDPFGTAHSSTSISAALGIVTGLELQDSQNSVVAVIGDGAISAGMAYEAMNNAGSGNHRLIVVLNDNDMSIDAPVGAMSAYLNRLISSRPYLGLREIANKFASLFPEGWKKRAKRAEAYSRGIVAGGTLFEELGFYYVGPIDGHNIDHLLPILRNVRTSAEYGPFLVHVRTQKGKGYEPAEMAENKYHGVNKFDVLTGTQVKSREKAMTYTSVFGSSLVQEGKRDEKIVAITAAMPSGTGVSQFGKVFPGRCFDVGIAEQHAVTFSAGLAAQGFKPFCAIYSTFMQRGYDQIIHDVVIQKLPVRFILDRAGFVGADGQTHQGLYDIAYFSCLPGVIIMAPANEAELRHMIATAARYNDGPSVIRYPRGEGVGVELPECGEALEIGSGRIISEGKKIAILSLGTRLAASLSAAEKLTAMGLSTTVADARFAKPLDRDLIDRLVERHEILLIIEEGACGGFGAQVLQDLAFREKLQSGAKVKSLAALDRTYDQASPAQQIKWAGLDADAIVKQILSSLDSSCTNSMEPA